MSGNNWNPEVEKRRVIAAACKFGDLIAVGVRHYCPTMRSQLEAIPNLKELRRKYGEVQGFIDNKHNFLTREEALALVKESGQPFCVSRNGGGSEPTELFSEGIH